MTRRRSGQGRRAAPLFFAGVVVLGTGLWIEHMRDSGAEWTGALEVVPADVFALAGTALGGLMILWAAVRRLMRGPGADASAMEVAGSPVYRPPRSQDAPTAEWQKRLAQKSRNGMVGYNAPVPGGTDAVIGNGPRPPRRRRFGAFRLAAIACVLAALGVGLTMVAQDMPEDTVPNLLARIGVGGQVPAADA